VVQLERCSWSRTEAAEALRVPLSTLNQKIKRWNIDVKKHFGAGLCLVHLDKSELPRDYVWPWSELSEVPELLEVGDLNSVSSCQTAGGLWVDSGAQLAVQVPSVVIPEEFNVLLNPRHTEYAAIVWSQPVSFRFDPRLFASEPQVS